MAKGHSRRRSPRPPRSTASFLSATEHQRAIAVVWVPELLAIANLLVGCRRSLQTSARIRVRHRIGNGGAAQTSPPRDPICPQGAAQFQPQRFRVVAALPAEQARGRSRAGCCVWARQTREPRTVTLRPPLQSERGGRVETIPSVLLSRAREGTRAGPPSARLACGCESDGKRRRHPFWS